MGRRGRPARLEPQHGYSNRGEPIMKTQWLALIEGSDSETLATLAGQLLGCWLDPPIFHAECKRVAEHIGRSSERPLGLPSAGGWSDQSWRVWLKKRASTIGAFRIFGPLPMPVRFETTMHVAFVGVVETSEHLAELLQVSVDEIETRDNTARSGITTTQQVIQPIDRVAARVI